MVRKYTGSSLPFEEPTRVIMCFCIFEMPMSRTSKFIAGVNTTLEAPVYKYILTAIIQFARTVLSLVYASSSTFIRAYRTFPVKTSLFGSPWYLGSS